VLDSQSWLAHAFTPTRPLVRLHQMALSEVMGNFVGWGVDLEGNTLSLRQRSSRVRRST
jgi:hypothetical protein